MRAPPHRLLLGIALLTGAASSCFGVTYTFRGVVDTGTFQSLLPYPSLANNGQVVFSGRRQTAFGIYRADLSGVHILAERSSTFRPTGIPAINEHGHAAFFGDFGDSLFEQGVFIDNGSGVLHAVSPAGVDRRSSQLGLNSSGEVAFEGVHDTHGRAVFKTTSGVLQPVTSEGSFSFEGNPVIISDAGSVAFFAGTESEGMAGLGLFVVNGGATRTVAHASTGFSFHDSRAFDMSSNEHLAFLGSIDGRPTGVYKSVGGEPVSIDESQTSLYQDVSINDAGQVAFAVIRLSPEVRSEIVLHTDGVNERVIQLGDALFGSTVSSLEIYQGSLNDHGDIAFMYALANGTRGIAVATLPSPAPVCACVVLFGVHATRRRRESR